MSFFQRGSVEVEVAMLRNEFEVLLRCFPTLASLLSMGWGGSESECIRLGTVLAGRQTSWTLIG